MILSELIEAVKDRVYMMGSQLSPSFSPESFYTYIDHTYLDIIQLAIKYERYDLISNLIVELTPYSENFQSIDIIYNNKVCLIEANTFTYAQFISGYFKAAGSEYRLPLEMFPTETYSRFVDSSNNIFYSKPAILFGTPDSSLGNENIFCSIVLPKYLPDEIVDQIGEAPFSGLYFSIKYAKVPKKTADMGDTEEFEVGELLQKELINKTSELIVSIFNPQVAESQIKTNSLISRL